MADQGTGQCSHGRDRPFLCATVGITTDRPRPGLAAAP